MALADYAQPTWSITPKQGQQLNTVAFDANARYVITSTSQEYGTTDVGVYCYNTDGENVTLHWSSELAKNVDYGTFWVAMCSTGAYCAAAGHTASDNGYLYIFDTATGKQAAVFNYSSRVNEIEFSANAELFIAVQGANVILGEQSSGAFTQATMSPQSGAYMRTCDVSENATWAVAAGAVYPSGENAAPTGIICFYQNVNGTLQYRNMATTDHEILRVSITADGQYVVATDNNGHVRLYSVGQPTPLWDYTPAYACDLTYAAAIAYNVHGEVMVGVGTNISVTSQVQSESSGAFKVQPGLIYVLKHVADSSSPTGYAASVQWQQRIQYPPNPGLNFDAQARYLTCATGQPYDTMNETTGSFYLFDGATGFQYWRFDTSIMNWPMQINSQATACVGGSDSGTLYYWGLPVPIIV